MPNDETRHAEGKCGICAIIAKISAGDFADFIAELPHSFVILGDAQFYRGYCIVLARTHAVEPHLMELGEAQALFAETLAVGASIAAVYRPRKMNYECLGNAEPHVHWHIFPRYESDTMHRSPVWARPEAERKAALEERERTALIASLRSEIGRRIPEARPLAR
jgi:diadenosine tetraphosphate (Ap4A) HIT family hydrolase